MPTYNETVTLPVGCSLTSVGNQVFAARSVITTLESVHGPKGVIPDVTTLLEPEQELKGVLPEITSTLEPTQTLSPRTKVGSVSSTLVPSQTLLPRTKSDSVESTLEPTQTIRTSASVLSNASIGRHNIELGLGLNNGGTFKKRVTNTLVPQQGIIGYNPAYVTLSATRYVTKNVATN